MLREADQRDDGAAADPSAFATFARLIRSAPDQDRPFFGDGHEFRGLLGGSLVIHADPRLVQEQFPPAAKINGETLRFDDCAIGRGKWQPHLRPVQGSALYREVGDVLAGGGIRNRQSFADLMRKAENGKPAIRYLLALDSEHKIERYFDEVFSLVESIRTNGYRTRARREPEEAGLAAAERATDARSQLVEMMETEVGMAVDADGALVRVGPGNHRFAIAHQLGLPRIPVELRLFHARWLREAFRSHGQHAPAAVIAAASRLNIDPTHLQTSGAPASARTPE
ncbi:hypothetical protein [Aestuariivirga sp.]|uniref:hypothetical protein n=1 Tax=Aestuariivirga sp. TaxID=2650926 RepID=UPI003592F3AA